MKKYIQYESKNPDQEEKYKKIEEDYPLDFEDFWTKIEKFFRSSDSNYSPKKNPSVPNPILMEPNYYGCDLNNFEDYEDGFQIRSSIKPRSVLTQISELQAKRQGRIFVKTVTGGYSGGSCWGDEATEFSNYYDISAEILITYIKFVIVRIFGESQQLERLIKFLGNEGINNISEDTWTDYEYYGNSDDWKQYSITLWRLYDLCGKFNIM